ncbi:msx2-interacting protein-like [Haliotis rubra]|uniref:msx2-interacting protein-like n=1 Tax=Haliotis rubra TaxID=36100 RepID=UPI001EE4FCFA|nr:msx2-interacting protein-like [Haliotis rubra]
MSDRFQFPRRYAKRETVKRPFQIVKTWLTPNVGDSNPGTSDADSTIQHEFQESSSPDGGDIEFTAASKPADAPVDPTLAETAESQEGQQKDIEAEPGPTVEEAEPPLIQEPPPGASQVEPHHDVPPEETEPEQEDPLQVCTEDHQDSDHDVEMPCIQDALMLELQSPEETVEATNPKSCTEPGLKDVEPDDALGNVDRWTVKNWTDVGNPETQDQGSEEVPISEQVVEATRPHTISDVHHDVPVSEQMPDITASSSEETADPASSSVNVSEQEKSESLSSEIVNENRATELSSKNGKSTPIQSSPTKEFSIRLDRIEVEKYLSSSNGKGSRETKTDRGSASQETSKTSKKIIGYKEDNASTSDDEDDEDRITSSTHVEKTPREKSHLQSKASEKKSATKSRPKSTTVLPEEDVPGSEDTMDSETSFQPVDDVTTSHKNVGKEHTGKVSKLSPLIKSASVRNKKNQARTERDTSSLESDSFNKDASPVTKKRAAVEVSKPKSAKQRKKSPKSESSPQSKATVLSNQQKLKRSAKGRTLSPDVEFSTSDSGSGKVKPHRNTPLRKTSPKMIKPHEDSSSEISQESEVDESYRRANSSKARSRFTESMPILEEAVSNRRSHSQRNQGC